MENEKKLNFTRIFSRDLLREGIKNREYSLEYSLKGARSTRRSFLIKYRNLKTEASPHLVF